MNRWIVALSCIALAACGGTRAAPSSDAPAAGGLAESLYEFSANTPNQLVRGSIRVRSTGTDIQFETACQSEVTTRSRPNGMPSSTSVMTHYCSGTWLTFDRRNPASAKWYATVQLPRRREVCSRYETQNGRQVCVSRTTETYYVNESRSGGIQVRRVQ